MIRRREASIWFKITFIGAILLFVAEEAPAISNLSGRLIWTYQDSRTPTFNQDAFVQHYEATLRDRLFEQNDMKLSFFLDTSKNFATDQTLRRYRGEVGIFHRYYSFDARFAPKQEITPLESPLNQEITEQRYNLDVHHPKAPRVRLYYSQRSQYLQGQFTGRIRDLRGDLNYRWKMFEFGINRWNARTSNSVETGTTVSGGHLGYRQAFGPMLNVQVGYDGQLTERTRSLSLFDTKTTSHTVNALASSFYRRIYSASFSLVSRHLKTQQITSLSNRNDTAVLQFKFLPTSPLRMEADWSYLLTQQDGTRNLVNYGTIQAVLTGPSRGRWHGLAQMTQRFLLQIEGNGVMPSNLYYVSLRGNIYRGIDARAEMNVSQQHPDNPSTAAKYQSTALFDLYLKPRPSWLIAGNVRATKYSDRLYFLKNNRFNYTLTANYFARQHFNMGIDLRRTDVTTGTQQRNNSVVFNANLRMRARSNINFSYGINEIEFRSTLNPDLIVLGSRANTLNLQAQVWITRRGSVSLNYSGVHRQDGNDTSYMALNYRQDF
jgi:hypothetical protein